MPYLQCAVVCCSVLQCVAACCSLLQYSMTFGIQYTAAVNCSVFQYISALYLYSVLQCHAAGNAVKCSILQYVAVCCSMLQYVAVCCSVLQSFMTTCRRHTKPNGSAHKKYRYRYNTSVRFLQDNLSHFVFWNL